MPHVALEWDHQIGKNFICWLVVECADIGQKFGGPQALPPRRDVAYFVNPKTAEADAKAFAEFKMRHAMPGTSTKVSGSSLLRDVERGLKPRRHAAFEWDHNIFSPLIRWAVLQWSGDPALGGPREDVAYFLDPASAEADAKVFSLLRDRRLDTHSESCT